MAVLGIGAILVMLFLLGLVVAVIAAIGMAIAHGRFGLAAAIVGGALLMVIILVGFAASLTVQMYESHPTMTATTNAALGSASHANFTVNGFPQAAISSVSRPMWRISFFPAVILVLAIGFILARSGKHHFAHVAAGGHVNRLAARLALANFGFFLFGGASNDHLAPQR